MSFLKKFGYVFIGSLVIGVAGVVIEEITGWQLDWWKGYANGIMVCYFLWLKK